MDIDHIDQAGCEKGHCRGRALAQGVACSTAARWRTLVSIDSHPRTGDSEGGPLGLNLVWQCELSAFLFAEAK